MPETAPKLVKWSLSDAFDDGCRALRESRRQFVARLCAYTVSQYRYDQVTFAKSDRVNGTIGGCLMNLDITEANPPGG